MIRENQFNKNSREKEIKKQLKIYEEEQNRYKQELKKNPNYKVVYSSKMFL